jgi:hydrogenase maturation protease
VSAAGAARLLVVACGNALAGDDSVGAKILDVLRDRTGEEVRLRFLPHVGIELLDLSAEAEAEAVLLVDAVVSGAPPGTLHLVALPSRNLLPRGLGSLSSHGWNLAETLGLARALDRSLPRMMLLGVEIGSVAPGGELSPAVASAVALVVERFPRLEALLLEADPRRWPVHRQFNPGDSDFPGDVAS